MFSHFRGRGCQICKGDDIPDKLNRGGRRIELDSSLACVQAAPASFLARRIGIFQPTEKLFIDVTWGSELHLIVEATLLDVFGL